MNKIIIIGIIILIVLVCYHCYRKHNINLMNLVKSRNDYKCLDRPYKNDTIELTNSSGCNQNYCGDDEDHCAIFDAPYSSNELLKYKMKNGYIQPLEYEEY